MKNVIHVDLLTHVILMLILHIDGVKIWKLSELLVMRKVSIMIHISHHEILPHQIRVRLERMIEILIRGGSLI